MEHASHVQSAKQQSGVTDVRIPAPYSDPANTTASGTNTDAAFHITTQASGIQKPTPWSTKPAYRIRTTAVLRTDYLLSLYSGFRNTHSALISTVSGLTVGLPAYWGPSNCLYKATTFPS